MAYSPSRRARITTESDSEQEEEHHPATLTQHSSPNVMSTPFESVFREDDAPRPYKYEFPNQPSVTNFQDGNDDDEANLTHPGMNHKHSSSSSPMRRRTTLQRVSRNFRRISLRVVNLGSAGVEEKHTRLPDVPNEQGDNAPSTGLRGRTLGFLGPNNPFRLAMYNFLLYQCV